VGHLLHIITSHPVSECVKKGVKEIAMGDLNGIRENTDSTIHQHPHHWPYRKVIKMIRYKGTWAGIEVRDDIHEKNTSGTCHACGKILASNRRYRGWYACSCDWKAHADVNGAFNIFERAFQVSPIRGSSGRVARPATVSCLFTWHGVVEPERSA
jgi:IS605 OrfB family transposase